MVRLSRVLAEKHHLKHKGRMQTTLFLKGFGLKVNDTIAFWKNEISHGQLVDYSKRSAYSVRHAYGLEGGRKDYEPTRCVQLIEDDPVGIEAHG